MELTSKQRAYLGGCASTLDPIFQIGKASLTPEIIQALDEALEKRELIKISVLKNCADDPREIAQVIAVSRNCRYFPRARSSARFLLSETPVFSFWITMTLGSLSPYSSQISPEASVLPSLTSSSS